MQLEFNKSSWAILAFTRFLLAVIVLIGHLHVFSLLPSSMEFIRSLGNKAAVLGFLIISGLSIGISYAKQHKGFIERRFLRIYPLYFFAVLTAILAQYLIGSPFRVLEQTFVSAGWVTNLANFFFLQGFIVIPIAYNGPLWSIAVEVFYYIFTPLFEKFNEYFLIGLILISMGVYAFLDKDMLFGYAVIKYAWPWLLGFLIATKNANRLIPIALLFLGAVCVYKVLSFYEHETLSHITFASTAFLIFLVDKKRINLSKFVLRIFNYLGELSYPLYLFHMPIYLFLYYVGIRNAYLFCILLLVITIPLNYFFDYILKKIFWVPIVTSITSFLSPYYICLNKKASVFLQMSTKSK